ncbi:MAG: tetratricopeptide repeat protein [bacterium]
MLSGLRLAAICIVLALIGYVWLSGCATFGPKRAPIDSLPDSTDVDTMTEALEGMALEYPEDANVFFALGNAYYDQAIPDQARQNYEKAIALDPKMSKARVNLAMLLAETGEPDSARAMLEDVIKGDPKDSRALTDLGMICYNLKDVDTAVRYYTRAIEADPKNPEAHYNLGVAFGEAGLVLEAMREWNTVLELVTEGDTANRARLAIERADGVLAK